MVKHNNISSNESIYLDQEGYENHLKKLENLNINLGRIYEKINELKVTKDNIDEFNELLSLKNELIERIRSMKEKTNKIVIVSKENNDEIIDINDTVRINICFSDSDKEEGTYTIIGGESDFSTDISKVSINSPIGKALYKSKVGDEVFYNLKNEQIKVEILEKIDEKKLVK